jgi:hypothetical protein
MSLSNTKTIHTIVKTGMVSSGQNKEPNQTSDNENK